MATFTDPRDSTELTELPVPDQPTHESLTVLRQLCRDGRLYEVEQWIRAGRPLHEESVGGPPRRQEHSVLEVALETGQHSLCRLLLSNGYDLRREHRNPLDLALRDRRWDLVDLLWEAGADPASVDLDAVFETYQIDIYERFWQAGVDLARDHALASFLSEHPANKPLLGFVKRHLNDAPALRGELNIALGSCIEKKKEKGIALCLWAGADPRARGIDIDWWRPGDDEPEEDGEEPGYTALYRAADMDRVDLLKRFKPDPALDDFDEMYGVVRSIEAVEYLAGIKPAEDLTMIIIRQLSRLEYPLSWQDRPKPSAAVLTAILVTTSVRWEGVERGRLEGIRRQLLKIEDNPLKDMLTVLRDPTVCDPAMYAELTRTPSMKERLRRFGHSERPAPGSTPRPSGRLSVPSASGRCREHA